MKNFIGIDLGDKKNSLCVLDKKGEIIAKGEFENATQGFREFFNRKMKNKHKINMVRKND